MGILGVVLLVFFIIVSAILILLVVVQDSDSEGLGGIFAGSSNSAFGSRTGNVLTRFTYIMGTLFFVFAFGLAFVNKTPMAGNVEEAAREKNKEVKTEWWNTGAQETTAPDKPAANTEGVPAVQPPADLPGSTDANAEKPAN